MADFENTYIKGKSLEQLVDELPDTAMPQSPIHEVIRAAIDVKIAERVAAPRKWAMIATIFAGISAAAAVAAAIAAF